MCGGGDSRGGKRGGIVWYNKATPPKPIFPNERDTHSTHHPLQPSRRWWPACPTRLTRMDSDRLCYRCYHSVYRVHHCTERGPLLRLHPLRTAEDFRPGDHDDSDDYCDTHGDLWWYRLFHQEPSRFHVKDKRSQIKTKKELPGRPESRWAKEKRSEILNSKYLDMTLKVVFLT